jgi:hypothetical protein
MEFEIELSPELANRNVHNILGLNLLNQGKRKKILVRMSLLVPLNQFSVELAQD